MKKLVLVITLLLIGTVTFAANNQKVGVLVLAHGGDSLWNATVTNAVKPLNADYTVEIAFGMADPITMQEGINKLEKAGVKTIVVVQLFASSYSMIIRQNEYLLGFRKELADPPMLMHHGHGTNSHASGSHEGMKDMKMDSHAHHQMDMGDKKLELKPLNIEANILLTKPLNDNPYVVSILLDRVKQLSTDPKNETVILVAHGPNDENDNRMWLATLQNISTQIKSAYGTHTFRNVTYLTLRDDASKEIYNAAKEHFRDLVKEADLDNGRALIVPVLLSKGGIEKRLQKRLDGLDYSWMGNTLLPDDRITAFMKTSIEEALNNQKLVSN